MSVKSRHQSIFFRQLSDTLNNWLWKSSSQKQRILEASTVVWCRRLAAEVLTVEVYWTWIYQVRIACFYLFIIIWASYSYNKSPSCIFSLRHNQHAVYTGTFQCDVKFGLYCFHGWDAQQPGLFVCFKASFRIFLLASYSTYVTVKRIYFQKCFMFVIIKNCSYKTVCLSLPLGFGPEGEMFIAGGVVHFVCFTNFSALFWFHS